MKTHQNAIKPVLSLLRSDQYITIKRSEKSTFISDLKKKTGYAALTMNTGLKRRSSECNIADLDSSQNFLSE